MEELLIGQINKLTASIVVMQIQINKLTASVLVMQINKLTTSVMTSKSCANYAARIISRFYFFISTQLVHKIINTAMCSFQTKMR